MPGRYDAELEHECLRISELPQLEHGQAQARRYERGEAEDEKADDDDA